MRVCVCARKEEREGLLPASLPRSLYASLVLSALPRSISPPRSLPFPPLHFLPIISSLCVCLSSSDSPSLPPSSPAPFLSPPLSFSSCASLLAVDVTEAEAEATLPLIGCHSQVSDKEKRREGKKTGRKAEGGGKSGGGGVREQIVPLHPSEHQLTVEWRKDEVRGWARGWTQCFPFFPASECIQKALRITGCIESESDGWTVRCLMSEAIGPI